MGLDKSTKKYSLPVQIGNAIAYGLSQSGSGTATGVGAKLAQKIFTRVRYGDGWIKSPQLGPKGVIDAYEAGTLGKDGDKRRLGTSVRRAAELRERNLGDADTNRVLDLEAAAGNQNLVRDAELAHAGARQHALGHFEGQLRGYSRANRNLNRVGTGLVGLGMGYDVVNAFLNHAPLPTPASPPPAIPATLSKGLRPSQPGNALDAWAGSALPQPDPTTNMAAW
jgi:hypothetical protein